MTSIAASSFAGRLRSAGASCLPDLRDPRPAAVVGRPPGERGAVGADDDVKLQADPVGEALVKLQGAVAIGEVEPGEGRGP